MSKLNDNQKERIVQLLRDGFTQQKIANFYEVSQPTISNVKQQAESQIIIQQGFSQPQWNNMQAQPQEIQPQTQKQTKCPIRIVKCPVRFII